MGAQSVPRLAVPRPTDPLVQMASRRTSSRLRRGCRHALLGDLARCKKQPIGTLACVASHEGQEVFIRQTPSRRQAGKAGVSKPVGAWTRAKRDAARAILLEAIDGGQVISRDPDRKIQSNQYASRAPAWELRPSRSSSR